MPNPTYSEIQKLQSPLYAMFSGRGGVSKKNIKERIYNPDPDDRFIKDLLKYLDSVDQSPEGFRTFFTSEEADSLVDKIESALGGDLESAKSAYSILNKRINDQSSWVNT